MTGVVTLMLSLGLLACTRPYQAPMPLDGQELVRVRLRADLSNHLSLGTPGLRVAVSDAGPSCPHRVPAGQRIERGSVVLLPGAGQVEIGVIAEHWLLLSFQFGSPGAQIDLSCDVETRFAPQAGYSYDLTFRVMGPECRVTGERWRGTEREVTPLPASCV